MESKVKSHVKSKVKSNMESNVKSKMKSKVHNRKKPQNHSAPEQLQCKPCASTKMLSVSCGSACLHFHGSKLCCNLRFCDIFAADFQFCHKSGCHSYGNNWKSTAEMTPDIILEQISKCNACAWAHGFGTKGRHTDMSTGPVCVASFRSKAMHPRACIHFANLLQFDVVCYFCC